MKRAQHPVRIYLVEDDPDSRTSFTMYLEHLGHSVQSATTVAAAAAGLASANCDVLIADIALSDGTGWDLMRLLGERGVRRPYAIAMSGFGNSSDREQSKAAGFRHHLLKPIKFEELEVVLAEAARESSCGSADRLP